MNRLWLLAPMLLIYDLACSINRSSYSHTETANEQTIRDVNITRMGPEARDNTIEGSCEDNDHFGAAMLAEEELSHFCRGFGYQNSQINDLVFCENGRFEVEGSCLGERIREETPVEDTYNDYYDDAYNDEYPEEIIYEDESEWK